ncbi:unnamed protein product, partial [marine sediment metagenome]
FNDAVMARFVSEIEFKRSNAKTTSSAYLYLKKKGLI